MSNRSTSIRLEDFESSVERIEIGIPQGSPISLILYLFYNADILEDAAQGNADTEDGLTIFNSLSTANPRNRIMK